MRFLFVLLALAGAARAASSVPPGAARAGLQEASTIAVLEFSDKLSDADRQGIDRTHYADIVRIQATRSLPWLKVFTLESVMAILEANGKSMDQCDAECDVQTGRLIGADLIVSGKILRLGADYGIDLRLYDTRSGALLNGLQVAAATPSLLDAAVRDRARELLSVIPPPRERGYLSRGLLAGGAAAAVVGGVFLLKTASSASDWHTASNYEVWSSAKDSAHSSANVSKVALGASAAMLAAGAGLLIFTRYW